MVFSINNRGVEPFKEGWVGAFEKAQRLFKFPSRQVCLVREYVLDGVLLFLDVKVPCRFMHIDKAYIPVAVLGCKSPGTAS